MILLCGIPSEPPLARVAHELDRLGVPTTVFNQRESVAGRARSSSTAPGSAASCSCGAARSGSRTSRAVYTRLMDDRILPELDSEPPDSPARTACRELHDTLYRWMEITPGARGQSRVGDGLQRLEALPGAARSRGRASRSPRRS